MYGKLLASQFSYQGPQAAQACLLNYTLSSMIPGVGKALKDVEIDNSIFDKTEAIIYSMTPAERENPAILNGSRKTRIAKGAGTDLAEVNKLLKQFDQTSKMMKMVAKGNLPKMGAGMPRKR